MPRSRHNLILPRIVLLCGVLADVRSFLCPFPCVREDCEIVRPESCRYGVVNDTCLCCTVCGLEPGRDCGDTIGFCGRGLECFKDIPDGLTAEERIFFPGICRIPISPPTSEVPVQSTQPSTVATVVPAQSTPSHTVAASTPSHTVAARTTESNLRKDGTASNVSTVPNVAIVTTVSPTSDVPGTDDCRYPTCSIEYCSGSSRRRICSARGAAHTKVARRGVCQYTSCQACFLHVTPPCSTTCRDIPYKPCLKRYDRCVENYLLSTSNSPILRLTDPLIASSTGRLVCYVPGVSNT